MAIFTPERNQVVGFRATQDFTNRFDELCHRLGHNRSSVARYALNAFIRSNWNNDENLERAKQEMY